MLRLRQEDSKPESPLAFIPFPSLSFLPVPQRPSIFRFDCILSVFYLIKFQLHLLFPCTAPTPGETLPLVVPAQFGLLISWAH